MSLFIYYQKPSSVSYDEILLPSPDQLLNEVADVAGFIPHWQIMSLYYNIKKDYKFTDAEDFWVARAIQLIRLCTQTAIYTRTSFISATKAEHYLIPRIRDHLKQTGEGMIALQGIPGYPTNMNLFTDQLMYSLMPVLEILNKQSTLSLQKPTFDINAIAHKVGSLKEVRLNLYKTFNILSKDEQRTLLHSLLGWLMIHPAIQHRNITVTIDKSLNIDAIDAELYIQLAINGLTTQINNKE